MVILYDAPQFGESKLPQFPQALCGGTPARRLMEKTGIGKKGLCFVAEPGLPRNSRRL